MSRFHFRLQTLLDQRIETKQEAEQILAAKEEQFAAEERTLEDLQEDVRRAEERYQSRRSERVANDRNAGANLTNRSKFLQRLKMDVQVAQSGVLSQQVFVDQASEALEEANFVAKQRRLDVDVLEKYRKKAEDRFLQEEAHKEELEQDEIGNVMHIGRRTKR